MGKDQTAAAAQGDNRSTLALEDLVGDAVYLFEDTSKPQRLYSVYDAAVPPTSGWVSELSASQFGDLR